MAGFEKNKRVGVDMKTDFFKTLKISCLIFFIYILSPGSSLAKDVFVLRISCAITPVVSEMICSCIEKAESKKAECLIIELDTPGGLDTSMREAVKCILNSSIPIVVYVYPSGARAASAGAFITLSAHISAMAPGTNIGAAHPVALGKRGMNKTMEKKVLNDACAYIRSIAKLRRKNVKVAEQFVRKSKSITEKEAKRLGVIDLVANDLGDLLRKLNGKKIRIEGHVVVLHTKGAKVKKVGNGIRFRILSALANPNMAYFLMMLGLLGIYFEFAHPGAILPGVVGAISLILAFYSFQTLPVNYAGLLLIILSLVLFILEVKIQSFGFLALSGIISFVLGSLMLFNTKVPYLSISKTSIVVATVFMSSFFIGITYLALKAQRRTPKTGAEGILGEVGEVIKAIDPYGKVFIHGEYWNAKAEKSIPKGAKVRVKSIEGLVLFVEKVEEGEDKKQKA